MYCRRGFGGREQSGDRRPPQRVVICRGYAESPDIVNMATAYTGRHRAQPSLRGWQ